MDLNNEVSIIMESKSQNEGFARIAAAAFLSLVDPNINDINEIKTVVSEAVTNAIIHGYENTEGKIVMNLRLEDDKNRDYYIITIEITDTGTGIKDIEEARQPLYTSKPELERSGMGFTVMDAFMDEVTVDSKVGEGTRVVMKKKIARI